MGARLTILIAVAALGAGCTAPQDALETRPAAASTPPAADWERTLPWGVGDGQATFRPGQPERLAEGPSAVAVGPDGDVLVLDRLSRRVLRVPASGTGAVRMAAGVPEDAEDLAVGPDGGLAAHSLLRARVFFYAADGAAAGELAVPRALPAPRGLVIGASRQTRIHTAFQETYPLGSPTAPQLLAAVLHGKRRGAAFLPDGRGVRVARRADGAVRLLAGDHRDGQTMTEVPVPGAPALAARVIGASGATVCLRVERAATGPGLAVRREAVCLDALTGAVRVRQALPDPGPYVPRTEVAVGGHPARLAWIRPTAAGLGVGSVALEGRAGR